MEAQPVQGKMFTCSICHRTVSKRASVQLPDGTRACREHPASAKALETKRDNEILLRETDPDKIRVPFGGISIERGKYFSNLAHMFALSVVRPITPSNQCDLWDHCWVCGHNGINRSDIPVLMLVATEKLKDSDPAKLFDVRERLKAAGILGQEILVHLSTAGRSNLPIALEYARNLHCASQTVMICKGCANKHHYMNEWAEAVKRVFGVGSPQPTPQLAMVLDAAYRQTDLHQRIKEFVRAQAATSSES